MGDPFRYDVFISHSSKDKPIARELAGRLKRDRLRVWFDEWEIRPGDSIPLKIEHGLEQSRVLLLLMSANAFASDWVTLERHTAIFRDPTNAERRFIPVRLDDSPISDALRQFLYIDWRTRADDQYASLRAACAALPGPTQAPVREQNAANARVLGLLKRDVSAVSVSADGRVAVSGSIDNTVRVWDLRSGRCTAILKGHAGGVEGVAITPDGRVAASGSYDETVRVWDLIKRNCVATLVGHTGYVRTVALTADGQTVVSGSSDKTVRMWDRTSARCIATLEGHTYAVRAVAVTADGHVAISGSYDATVRVWDLTTARCVATLEGHDGPVWGVAVTADGHVAISGSYDATVRVWDLTTARCVAILEGHVSDVLAVAVTADGRIAVSGSADKTVRLWNLASGRCAIMSTGHTNHVLGVAVAADGRTVVSGSSDRTVRVWDLATGTPADHDVADTTRFANAKVVLVGATGVGKTGLALRLCEDRWEPTESTHGMMVSQLRLPSAPLQDIEREVWLWDFAGQPDYRLISQLYMDETALGLVVFDPQDDNPFEEIAHWEKALNAATRGRAPKLLVAARTDRGGITISQKRFEEYMRQHGFAGLIATGAKTGEGCKELQDAIARYIPWDQLPWTATTHLFKTLKDAILKLKEDRIPLVRLPELRQRLQLMLSQETIGGLELRAVVGLMQGQGVVQALDFGDFVLLQPEHVNAYASVVVRMAREHVDEMGCVPEQQVLDGRLEYKEMHRLEPTDEKILLRAMAQTFLDRSLCLREQTPAGTLLVFPSYFRRDRPEIPEHPNVLVTYGFEGPLDEIYATLVVRLSYSDGFKKDQLWKDAADFKSAGGKRVGLAMRKKGEGTAEIVVYFEPGVPDETRVLFIKYVHEHLLGRAQNVTRVRTHVCPHCDTPLENRKVIEDRIRRGLTDILCANCEKRVPLIDLIEEKFASDEFLQRVREMDERAKINLDNESRELILVGHAFAIAGEAGQIFRPTPNSDWGIDGEIEFKNDKGEASGKRVYLQLKSGDSYLHRRARDEKEIFTIKNPRHAEYWQAQPCPVMLVIRTSDGKIRWMNVTDYLRKRGTGVKQIAFDGEPFTALNLVRLRDRLMGSGT